MLRFFRLTCFSTLILFVTSCNQSQLSELTQGVTNSPTAVVIRILDLDANQPSSNSIPVQTGPTAIPVTSEPDTPSIVPTDPTISQSTTTPSETCSNQAEFIKHLTISDNTSLINGQVFGKVWQVKNIGTCTWSSDYALIFMSGDQMGSQEKIPLPHIVNPGETVDLRVDLQAPAISDTFVGNWILTDAAGNKFGFGEDGDQPLVVTIFVKPTARPTPG